MNLIWWKRFNSINLWVWRKFLEKPMFAKAWGVSSMKKHSNAIDAYYSQIWLYVEYTYRCLFFIYFFIFIYLFFFFTNFIVHQHHSLPIAIRNLTVFIMYTGIWFQTYVAISWWERVFFLNGAYLISDVCKPNMTVTQNMSQTAM